MNAPHHTILIVEDDEDLRTMLSTIMASEGFAVAVAGNGQEALDYLHSAVEKPSIIFLDLMMPVMDGWEFRARQMADPHITDIPVVVISALDEAEAPTCAAFFHKPLCDPRPACLELLRHDHVKVIP